MKIAVIADDSRVVRKAVRRRADRRRRLRFFNRSAIESPNHHDHAAYAGGFQPDFWPNRLGCIR